MRINCCFCIIFDGESFRAQIGHSVFRQRRDAKAIKRGTKLSNSEEHHSIRCVRYGYSTPAVLSCIIIIFTFNEIHNWHHFNAAFLIIVKIHLAPSIVAHFMIFVRGDIDAWKRVSDERESH